MLRTCSRMIALTAMLTYGLVTAQAADTTLTLACQGTTADTIPKPAKPATYPISMGIIVNFTNRTVQGFFLPGGSEDFVKLTEINEVAMTFDGSLAHGSSNSSIRGTIDRVTGAVDATITWSDANTGSVIGSTDYTLKCRPAQRMF